MRKRYLVPFFLFFLIGISTSLSWAKKEEVKKEAAEKLEVTSQNLRVGQEKERGKLKPFWRRPAREAQKTLNTS